MASQSSDRHGYEPRHVQPDRPVTTKEAKEAISEAQRITVSVAGLLETSGSGKRKAREAYTEELEDAVRRRLREAPIEEIKKVASRPIQLKAVRSAGVHTVGAAQRAGGYGLQSIRGVGRRTSTRILSAAQEYEGVLRRSLRVRFDVENRPETQTSLLYRLRTMDFAHQNIEPLRPRLEELLQSVQECAQRTRLLCRWLQRFFAGKRRKARARAAYRDLVKLLRSPATLALTEEVEILDQRLSLWEHDLPRLWDDYLARPLPYNELLDEIGEQEPQEEASQGFLPKEIVDRVNAFSLNARLLTASLRGYQSFGAKYALVQERTILGDEMGLGKTIEALAVICHLHNGGAKHSFVVCPASVLANWEHEIRRHTRMRQIWRLHGMNRGRALQHWAEQGGIAITTFDTLRSLDLPNVKIAAVVVDEAHYVKNPRAKRTKAVRTLLAQSKNQLLMSGTPMENRVEEFRTLISHLRPDLTSTIRTQDSIAGPNAFRRAVAPVYLRRNQEDVLGELPGKIEVDEWLTLHGSAAEMYRRAVLSGNFMAVRRAAFMTEHPLDSPKLTRLLELAEEAMANDRKVVVFSFFRDVINRTCGVLGSRAFGPLTGSVSGPNRQQLLDEFSRASNPSVLVSQIEAGGVGLNIQAASVVILTEPQWKPSTEEQAIARCYRMGQVRPVQVHRLLTEDSVDEHMKGVLSHKSALFAEYAKKSAIKDLAPEAVDSRDGEATQVGVSQAELERRIIEFERQRLGLDT